MPSHDTIQINLVEIRHQGGTLQLRVDSLTDYIHGTVKNRSGEDIHFSEQAKDIEKWAASHEGVEARSATIVPPKISLDILFKRPGFRQTLNLGAVCDTVELIMEARASGAFGTMFTKGDVETILEQDTEGYKDLTPEEKEEFLDENLYNFTKRLDDVLSQRGNDHIADRVADEFDDALEGFKKSRNRAPGL
ncbi:hypothetical protein [Rhizobium sp. MHM7A]|uniref:hypothetical protein n=1 Tax=Rhizobium sp. MHM7A TaxID=2583233 RepID=UPI001107412F|nr:hypothetical protein [Rhizobium sp. MHM7A]TLX15803.1 hypothetical protein FFR93_00360 [Rhizobium sp. MHM7A]